MANKIYGAFSLVGGLSNTLDSIDGNNLEHGDAAIVCSSTKLRMYTLDIFSGASENIPYVVAPDSNPGNKRWLLVSEPELLSEVNEDIIPDLDITRSLGSLTKQWKDVFVGPGSLYVNGQQVVSDDSGTIVVSADEDQNLQVKTSGTGDVELLPSGSGVIQLKGGITILAGKNLMSSDGNAISVTDAFSMNGETITGLATPTADSDAATKAYVVNLATNASNLSTGTIPSSVLPPIAITTTQTAVDETAHLTLTTEEGDVVVRTDESRSYIHNGGSTGTMSDFTELSTPVDAVLSVNGDTGTIVLNQDDIGDGSTYVRTVNDFTDILLSKLNGIQAEATDDLTASEILTLIKTVDGVDSGLDANVLNGYSLSNDAVVSTVVARNSSGDIYANAFIGSGAGLTGVAGFIAGTSMIFNQASAPIGWTKKTNWANNASLIIGNTYANGGSDNPETWTTAISVSNHTLTTAEMPSHIHNIRGGSGSISDYCGGSTADYGLQNQGPSSATNTASTGSGSGHSHGIIQDIYAPRYQTVISASKDE